MHYCFSYLKFKFAHTLISIIVIVVFLRSVKNSPLTLRFFFIIMQINVNLQQAEEKIFLIKKRLPSLFAKTLTDIAKSAKIHSNKTIAKTYDNPTPQTTKSTIHFAAEKTAKIVKSSVLIKTRYAGGRAGTPPQIYLSGTTGYKTGFKPSDLRLQKNAVIKSGYKLTPTKVIKKNKYSNVSLATYKSVLQKLQNYKKTDNPRYFVNAQKGFRKHDDHQAIWRVTRYKNKNRKEKVEPLFFVRPIADTHKIFDFENEIINHVNKISQNLFAVNADTFIARAIK